MHWRLPPEVDLQVYAKSFPRGPGAHETYRPYRGERVLTAKDREIQGALPSQTPSSRWHALSRRLACQHLPRSSFDEGSSSCAMVPRFGPHIATCFMCGRAAVERPSGSRWHWPRSLLALQSASGSRPRFDRDHRPAARAPALVLPRQGHVAPGHLHPAGGGVPGSTPNSATRRL